MFLKTKSSAPEHVVCAKHMLYSVFLVYNMNTENSISKYFHPGRSFQKLSLQWPETAFMCERKVKIHRKSFVYTNTYARVDKKRFHAEQ